MLFPENDLIEYIKSCLENKNIVMLLFSQQTSMTMTDRVEWLAGAKNILAP